jgi:subtilisin-like proprotein convertase family protein
MRKIYAALLSLLFLLVWNSETNAQVSAYSFSQSSGTFTPITGGTVLGNTASDDEYFVTPASPLGGGTVTGVGFPIGFNFVYNEIVFDRFAVNNNGWISLGQAALTPSVAMNTTSAYTPLSSTATNTPAILRSRIAGMGRDLQGQAGSELRFETIGSAPNRKLVVQWTGYKRWNIAAPDNFTFQIILNETTNAVQVVYGTFSFNTTTTNNTINHVGLGGQDPLDFHNRQTTAPHDWNTTTAGTTNTQGLQNGNSTTAVTVPASGLTFTWTPPDPCSGTPTGGTTQSSLTSACTGVPFTLSVTGATSGAWGLTYQWESSPNGTTWTNIAGATGTTYVATQTASTYYRRKITCAGVDSWSSSLQVGVSLATLPITENFATYLTTFPPTCWTRNNATYLTGNAVSAFGVGVGSAKFDFWGASAGTQLDLVLPQFAPATGYYLSFDHAYATFTTQVDRLEVHTSTDGGATYTIAATFNGGTAGPLNTVGAPGTAGSAFTPTAGQWNSKVVALPANTNRVMLKGVSAFGNNLYLDNIRITACAPPTGIAATAITTTTTTLNWTASPSSPSGGYEWEVRTSGAGGSGATGLTASGSVAAGVTTANVTGLTSNTAYNIYVRANCGSEFSAWAGPVAFRTECDPFTLPWGEDFAGYAVQYPPFCWARTNATFTTGNAVSAFGSGSGSTKFDFYNASSGTQMDLRTPAFTATTAGYWLTFDHAYATFAGEVDRLEILYSTDGGANYTNLTTYNGGAGGPLNTGGSVLPAFTPLANQWASKAIALPAGTNRLIFRAVSAFGNNLYVDNIRVTACVQPTNITSTAITQTTATINWTASASNPASGYEWEVRSSGAAGSGATGLAASGSTAAGVVTANVTGLVANTLYSVYVRSNCGSEFSVWTAAHQFRTDCDPYTLPLFENFATYATTFPPTCWSRNNTTFLLGAASSGFGVGTGSARFNFYAALSGTFDLRTPPFTPTAGNYFLMFDHAYATFAGEVDRLEILYSTDGGATYTGLTTYNGGLSGPLNTGGSTFASFVPTAAQWASKVVALPAGTNRLIFRGVSAFGNDLFLDNIRITSCLPPTGVTASAITQTTATVSWTASASNPSNGYQWEVRTSGAAGSGATGLAQSGNVAAGVTSVNVTGLTTGTAYSVYVRSDCGGSDFSAWTNAYSLITLCNPITTFPYTETFENSSTTRICWRNQTLSGAYQWTYGAGSGNGGPVTSAHGGTLNAQYFGSFYGAEQALLISPELNLTTPAMVANGADLEFWVANPSWLGDINPLRVLYKTSAGGTWNVLPGGVFNTAINSWTKIEIPNLPNISSTYYIAFEGTQLWGWGIAIDDVVIKEGPSCRKPTNVSAIGITPTSIEVTFTSPGTNFIVEYGAPGFTPGTGATAGVGGTIVTGTASPIIISGLTPSTNYDVYIRRECIAGVDYSENVKVTTRTQCAATTIPYLQNFETAAVPAMPTCTSIQDVNGNSGSFWFGTGAGGWETYTDANPLSWVSPNRSLLYYYDFNNLTRPADDWFFTQGVTLTAGTTYRLKFFYKALDGVNFPERLEVKYGMGASVSNMTSGTLFTNNNISSVYASPFDSVRVDFTPTATGVYYLGFHANSLADMFGILIDDISVKIAPLVDVGISNITLPNLTCPANNVYIQAEVKNYNLTPVNFANTPVNVNARIVLNGTTTTNLPATTLNSGVLAPNETMGIYLTTSYNFVAGTHDITLNTTSPQDPEVLNDTLKRTVMVNPNPPVPVITPAAPQVCLGNSVQLTVPTPAPANATSTTSSGAISVAVPDGVAAGTTSTLNVTGIPAGATITGISVNMNLTHTWISDMSIGLKAPNGRILNLFNQKGGSGDNLVNTTVSSTGTATFAAGAPPYTGVFAADAAAVGPTGNVADATAFADLYPNSGSGSWSLVMRDHVFFDGGTLTSWSITINYSYVPTLTWTPSTELFTNAATTTPYVAGTSTYSVYVKPTVTRTYTATSTGAGGCTSTGTVTVTVNPVPVVTVGSIPDTVCISDQTIPLVASPAGGTWSGIGVSGNNFLPPTTAVGNYLLTYTYTNTFGCTATATKRIWVEDCPDRIVLLRDNAIILFPNPTDGGRFNIRINSVLYNNLTMRVYTNGGAIVRTQKFTGLVYGRVVPIDLSALPGGVYVVEFAHENAGPRTAEKSFKVIIGH